MATGTHPEVGTRKLSRSKKEQDVGQSRVERAKQADDVKSREHSMLHRLQGKFLCASRWNSAGCLVPDPVGSRSHLLPCKDSSNWLWLIYGFISLEAASKNYFAKNFKVTLFIKNARYKPKDGGIFLLFGNDIKKM